MTDTERERLAAQLTLPLGIFTTLKVMYLDSDDFNQPAFVFPERDAGSSIIGYTLRYADGTKRNHGRRGLSIPCRETPSTDTIYLCEGASDTLALTAMNLIAIGRPSNTGGVEYLVDLLRDADPRRNIVVMGEMDQKPDGTWPGREGMEATARKLAHQLGRTVYGALPPIGVKDVRELIVSDQAAIRGKTLTLRQLGKRFAEHCTATAEQFTPQAADASIAVVTIAESIVFPNSTLPRKISIQRRIRSPNILPANAPSSTRIHELSYLPVRNENLASCTTRRCKSRGFASSTANGSTFPIAALASASNGKRRSSTISTTTPRTRHQIPTAWFVFISSGSNSTLGRP